MYAVTEQFKDIFVQMYRLGAVSTYLVAYASFGTLTKSLNLNLPLAQIEFYSLTGARVVDYVNPTLYLNESYYEKDQLMDFHLGLRIPSIQADNVLGVFYMSKIIE